MGERSRRATLRELRGLRLRGGCRAGDEVLLLTPVGGLERRATTPMNVAGYRYLDGLPQLTYVLPLDSRRLADAWPEPDDKRLFTELWYALDEAVDGTPGPGLIWQSPVGVGQSPGPTEPPWVELWKPRPWLEIGELPGHLRVVVPCTSREANHPRLQAPVPAEDLEIADPVALDALDMAAELAHFAVVRPDQMGWRMAGQLHEPSVDDVRDGFLDWPQRQSGMVAY